MTKQFTVLGRNIGELREDGIFVKHINVKEHFYRKGYGWCFSWSKLHELYKLGCKEIRIIATSGDLTEEDVVLINDKRLPNRDEEKVFRTTPEIWIHRGFSVHYNNFETQYCLPLKYFNKMFVEKKLLQKDLDLIIKQDRYDC